MIKLETAHIEEVTRAVASSTIAEDDSLAAAPRQCPRRRPRLSRRQRQRSFAAYLVVLVLRGPTRKQERRPQV